MISGIIYSCQYLVLVRDEPLFAIEIIQESGFSIKEFLKEQKYTGYQTRKMNKVIREAFKNK